MIRALHVLDHSIPLHSGYTFRTAALLREQRALGWQTFHLTSPKQGKYAAPFEEVDGLRFYRTPLPEGPLAKLPILRELALMRRLEARLEEVARAYALIFGLIPRAEHDDQRDQCYDRNHNATCTKILVHKAINCARLRDA